MNKPTRRTLIAVGAVFGTVVVLLIALPLLFGGRIADRVKVEVNRKVEARIDWQTASLGLFRNFPNLTLRLGELTAVGTGRFEGDTLAAVQHLGVVLDLPSALGNIVGGSGPIVVRAVELDQPRLSLLALEDGTANWDIMKEAAQDTGAGRPLSVSLRRFTIEDGALTFDNRAAGLMASLAGIDQTLSGDFGKERFDFETRLVADTTTLEFAGITYLSGVRVDLAADFAADMNARTFTLKEGTGLQLNELPLTASGTVTSAGERLGLDLVFNAPTTRFREFLSLVPAVYAHDFESVRSSGSFAVSGRVQGEYGDDAFPAFSFTASVDSGAFQYPDLPLPARDISLDLVITNPGGNADSTLVNLSRLRLVLGRNPIEARLLMRTPISDPDLDARLAGRLDLADLRRTIKLEGVEELAGVITADAAVSTRMSAVDAGQYDRVTASGTINIRDVAVQGEALPHPLAISEASLQLAPRRAELQSFSGTVGSSDLRATGFIDNLLGYLLRDEDLRGTATLTSNRFNLDEWRRDEGGLSVIPVPAGIDFLLDATVAELLYDKLVMNDARGRLRIKDQRLTLESFALNLLGGSMTMDGFYETTTPARPTFNVALGMNGLDIPSAFAALNTVQVLAPVAKYAQGSFSSELRLTGPLGQDMVPLFEALSGQGTLRPSELQIRDFPVLERMAGATKLAFLNDPAIRALSSRFEIREGRLHVQPFAVTLGEATMEVSGSNGLDQSLDYEIRLRVPRSLIGSEANQAIAGLVSRAAGAGIDLQTAPTIALGTQVGGTVTDPTISLGVGSAAESVAEGAGEAVREAADERVEAAVDSVRERATEAAEQVSREVEARAEAMRAEAETLAVRIRQEGHARADSLVARSGDNPIARAAAEAAASRLREEADNNAARIVREADERADALVEGARR
ncbi:MAG TPA: AsmA-like C-terminal region-containing protein [Gemmatimonadales bacterium]|nr:AsmA-like C-terminal region-containing protein [Gemmatimonadales bacterium]